MIDDIRGRKINDPNAEPRSAPPVPRELLRELATEPPKPSADQPAAQSITVRTTTTANSQSVPVATTLPATTAAAPDSSSAAPAPQDKPKSKGNIFRSYWHHKWWTLPMTLLVIAAAYMAVPTTRYMTLAYFISRQFTVTVTDSSSNTPISGAIVKLDGRSATTDSAGKAVITVPVGSRTLQISKTYYQSSSQAVFVDLSANANSLLVHLVATGRLVPLKVINKITGKPIPEAAFTIGQTTATTDLTGQAAVVLPTGTATLPAIIKADGYTDLTTTVQITTSAVPANIFSMVPVGRVYFLSNASGSVDVVSTNLDGSGRSTVVAGTGNEDAQNTVLLATRDWKYLALLSKRDGGSAAKLFLINTSNNSLVTIDDSGANFTLDGWSGHYFVYTVQRPSVSSWQPNQQSIISYNADTKTAKTLVNSQATGTTNLDAQYQDIVYTVLFGSNIVYTTTWYKYPAVTQVTGQTDTMVSIKPDGTGSRTLKSVDAGTSYFDSVNLASPSQLYFAVYGSTPNYYRLDSNDNITQSSTITSSTVTQVYPTYILSPSGMETFWTVASAGKNNLTVGDSNGANGSAVATATAYAPFGWFSDSYLLVQNSGSLYIMPIGGGTPLKIADFLKPGTPVTGYGTSYGGL